MAKHIFLATVFGASAFSLSACDASTGPEDDPGSLRMGLVGQDDLGNVYRLRDGVFDIDGPETTSLSTEASATPSDTLTVELTAGDYGIFLNDGWRLERWDPMTDETLDVTAMLTSANPASTLITGTETSTVVFSFYVADAGPVILGDGDLVIDIDIDVDDPAPPEPTACDPLAPACGPAEACYPYSAPPLEFVCAPVAMEGGLYETCEFVNGCSAGLACLSPDANASCSLGGAGCCVSYCDTSAPSCNAGETCQSASTENPVVGYCTTP